MDEPQRGYSHERRVRHERAHAERLGGEVRAAQNRADNQRCEAREARQPQVEVPQRTVSTDGFRKLDRVDVLFLASYALRSRMVRNERRLSYLLKPMQNPRAAQPRQSTRMHALSTGKGSQRRAALAHFRKEIARQVESLQTFTLF